MTERYREDFFRDDFRPLFFDAPFRADLRPPFFAAPLRAPLRELLFLPADFLPPFFLVAMCGLQYWCGTLDRSPGGSVSMAALVVTRSPYTASKRHVKLALQ